MVLARPVGLLLQRRMLTVQSKPEMHEAQTRVSLD